MRNASKLNGRSLVILKRTTDGFQVAASGFLRWDGATLSLPDEPADRIISAEDLAAILPMRAAEREFLWLKLGILGGFEFLLITERPDPSAYSERE